MKKRWILRQEPADFQGIGQRLGISPVVVRCIRNRGPETEEEMRRYLAATLDDLYDPMLMRGIPEAVEILTGILTEQDGRGNGRSDVDGQGMAGQPYRIAVASDYDCDGICSGTLLKNGLEALGFTANIYTPDRVTEGYGLNRRIVDDALADGCSLLITCDNGIAAVDGVSYAKEQGLTVIVTDHHEPQETLPPADVIIDPKAEVRMRQAQREGTLPGDATAENYPFPGLCGAGVVYKLITALYNRVFPTGFSPETPAHIPMTLAGAKDLLQHELLELAAIATVADVMELVDENRILVKYGLRSLRHTDNKGLRQLLRVLRLEERPLKGSDIGFRIGPTLNATGRISDVKEAFALLLAQTEAEASQKAEELNRLNEERKAMTDKGTEEAIATLLRQFPGADMGELDDVIVVHVPGVHESLVGLIAGKIKERFNHPAIAFTECVPDEKTGEKRIRGSGRSIHGYHMFDKLLACKDLTVAFGGHEMAAGLTIPENNLDELRRRLNDGSGLCADDLVPDLLIDLEVPVSHLSENLINEIEQMGPFGVANPRPVFAQRDLHITQIRYLGQERRHLKLYVSDGKGTTFEALAFSRAGEFDEDVITHYGEDELESMRRGKSSRTITLAYQPEINEFNGMRSIQLKIVEWNI